MMTLAELVSRRLMAAGFHYDDPALVAIRRHNAAAYARHSSGRREEVENRLQRSACGSRPGPAKMGGTHRRPNIAKPGT